LEGPSNLFPAILTACKTMRGSGRYDEFGLRVASEINVKEGAVRDVLCTFGRS
jgi:hypothetical protein